MTVPVVTVMCPSRGRPEALTRSITGLRDLADQPDRVQVIVRADGDDPALAGYGSCPIDRLIIGRARSYQTKDFFGPTCTAQRAEDATRIVAWARCLEEVR